MDQLSIHSKKWVALKGTGPSALAIQFDLKFFENSEDVTSLILTNLKKFSTLSNVNSTSTESIKQKILKFVAIPPFIANSYDSSSPMKLLDVPVHFLAETNSFDTKHKGLNGFPKAEEETRHLIKFMWEASMVKFPTTIYINSLDPHVLE